MAVPKKKPSHTQSATKEMAWRRKSQKKIFNLLSVSRCPNCNEPKKSHTICLGCGEYKAKKKPETKQDTKAPTKKPSKET